MKEEGPSPRPYLLVEDAVRRGRQVASVAVDEQSAGGQPSVCPAQHLTQLGQSSLLALPPVYDSGQPRDVLRVEDGEDRVVAGGRGLQLAHSTKVAGGQSSGSLHPPVGVVALSSRPPLHLSSLGLTETGE